MTIEHQAGAPRGQKSTALQQPQPPLVPPRPWVTGSAESAYSTPLLGVQLSPSLPAVQ